MSKRAIRRHHTKRMRRKGTKIRCRCRKHRRGRPRVEGGMCKLGARDRIYEWRKQRLYLNLAVTQNGYVDLLDDLVCLLDDAKALNKDR